MCQKALVMIDLIDGQGVVKRLIILERLIYVMQGASMEKARQLVEKQDGRKKQIEYTAAYRYALHAIKSGDKKKESLASLGESEKQEISVKITHLKNGGSSVKILNEEKLPLIMQEYLIPVMKEILLCQINSFEFLGLEKTIDPEIDTIIFPDEIRGKTCGIIAHLKSK